MNRVSNDGSLTLSQEEYGFDAAGRLTRHRRKMPDGIWATSERRYNPQGWLTFASEAENATSPTKGTTFAGFDPFGRPSVIYGPDHNTTTNPYAVTTLSYSGDRVINRGSYVRTGGDANTLTQSISTTAYMFDRQGRLFRITEPSRPTGLAAVTQYGYHASGHVGSITTTGQEATQYRVLNYDGRGLLSFEQHPERGYSGTSLSAVGYGYDAVGQLRARQFLGTVLYYTYDIAGRLVSVSDHNSQTIKSFTYYGTNAAGRSNGKLWTATRYNYLAPKIGRDVTITETYQYGGRDGRVSQRSTSSSEGVNFSQSWTYNDLGHPVSIEYPECTGGCPYAATDTISSTYDETFLRSIPSWATEIAYHPNGLVSRIDYADGSKWHQLADASGIARPSVISTSSGGVTTWQTGMYKYDGSGNVAAIGSDYFTYDLVGRLKLGTAFQAGNRRQEYTYDTFGNITSTKTYQNGSLTSTRAPGINSAMNRLSGGYANYYTDGNLGSIQTEGVGYEWDQVDRLRSFSFLRLGVNRTWVYAYTADDERIWSYDVTGNASWWRVRDLDQKVLAEFTHAGASGWSGYKTYVYQNGRLLGANTPYEATGARKYFATDHLGTPRRIATSAGSIAYHQYYPFGEEATHPATDQERMKFTGHERDLCCDGYTNYSDNMHARVYNPIHGRFLSPDPVLGNLLRPQSWNRYAYVLGSPLNWIDPDGLEPDNGQPQIIVEGEIDVFGDIPTVGLLPLRLRIGPLRGFGSGTSANTATTKPVPCPAMPIAPPSANLTANVGAAEQHYLWDVPTLLLAQLGPEMHWFKAQVGPRGPWDYKRIHTRYEPFGNFHYGLVGAAMGIPTQVLLRGAGFYQPAAAQLPFFGNWWGGRPYGDDPADQVWIEQGIEYYKKGCV